MKQFERVIAIVIALALLNACNSEEVGHPPNASPPHRSSPVEPLVQAPNNARTMQPLAAERVDQIVNATLRAQYPAGMDGHSCWRATYGAGDDGTDYCMRPLPAMTVAESGEQVIYIATASAADITDDPRYRYSAVDPGMFDAFRVTVAADGSTRISAASRGMDFGSAGDCSCADADFVPLGPDVHGWAFSSGVTQQGQTSSTHNLIAPVGGTFRDVAALPEYVEDDPDVEYRLAIGSEKPTAGWYPLTISKYRNGRMVSARALQFDPAAKRYTNPGAY